ncbi:TPA: L-valine transporter subunit YgaH, partial [Klebsiella pneumoniae]|nr:L-valine transporter subunit YgaH [Klebsiella pneumoniae]
MNSEVLLLGVIVGGVNYLFRYLPLRLRVGRARPA